MTYKHKLSIIKISLIDHCDKVIMDNHNKMFDMWLSMEADMAFGDGYLDRFKEQFGKYMTSETNDKIWFAGKNIVFVIEAFISSKKTYKLLDLRKFVKNFVTEQIDDFDNWCDDISMAYDEENPV